MTRNRSTINLPIAAVLWLLCCIGSPIHAVADNAQKSRLVVPPRFVVELTSSSAAGPHAAAATALEMKGGRSGPDLTRIGTSRSARDLVESIVAPSSTIAQGFDAYNILTVDGTTLSGIVQEPSAETVVVIDSARQPTRIRRKETELMQYSSTSIMPDGFGTKLTPEEFSNLVDWLKSLR